MNASETTNYEDIFVLKNKLSKYLPQLLLPLPKGARRIRLCVPYPKVEPPEISPKFDEEVLKDVHVDAIEPKPEAPWILKEDNSIKFTEKM